MKKGRVIARVSLGPVRNCFLILALLISLIPNITACGKSQTQPPNRTSSPVTDDDDDTVPGPDYSLCQAAFDYMGSQCGAQFFDQSGNVMTQNSLVEACGQPKASCVTGCYSASQDCAKIRTCLKDTCGL